MRGRGTATCFAVVGHGAAPGPVWNSRKAGEAGTGGRGAIAAASEVGEERAAAPRRPGDDLVQVGKCAL